MFSKKLYMDLMKIFSDRAPKLKDSANSVEELKHLEYILLVLETQLQTGKTESKVGALKWINLMFTIGITHGCGILCLSVNFVIY